MIRKLQLTGIVFFISVVAFCQPNLKIWQHSIKTTTLNTADYFEVICTVKNVGNQSAGFSHLKILLCTNLYYNSVIQAASVSTEQLLPNQESAFMKIIFPISSNVATGNYWILYSVDDRMEVMASNSLSYDATQVYINNNNNTNQCLPYPIIFIHGLNDNYTCWKRFADRTLGVNGFSYGGIMHFCLNYDSLNSTALLSSKEYHDFISNETPLSIGDYCKPPSKYILRMTQK